MDTLKMMQSNIHVVSTMLVISACLCLGLSACGGGNGGGGGGGSGFPSISEVEPNDSRLNPQPIASLPVTVRGTAGHPDDTSSDFFLITLTATGNITASLSGAASQDLDLFLYDTVSPGSGTGLIAISAQVGSIERISVNGLPAGTYVVAMVPFFLNAMTSYTLDISVQASSPSGTSPI